MKQYFEGWYFKQQAGDSAVALIPALHGAQENDSASLQIVTQGKAYHVLYPKEALRVLNRDEPDLILGSSRFSTRGIHLDVATDGVRAVGDLVFGASTRLKQDIMGPFQFVPFMECRHSVFSMSHTVCGSLVVNGTTLDFAGGQGYLEGDRGSSFPKHYLWTQCLFPGGSVMLSVAQIPFLGRSFTGVIGVVLLNGREYRFATYLGARVAEIGSGSATVRQGNSSVSVQLLERDGELLAAPVQGAMTRQIREHLVCRARYRFCRGDKVVFDFESSHASFEDEFQPSLSEK